MRAKLMNRLEKLRTSFWFIPSLLAFAGVLLAGAAVQVDRLFPAASGGIWQRLMGGTSESATQLFSTLAGSMITVTGVVFSITIVTLSLASGQFGPRLLRSFMRDRGNQLVLGTFIGTFLYAFVSLIVLRGGEQGTEVPRAAVTGALLLTGASIGVLIYFIHHISVSIQADSVVANVAREMHGRIDRLYPRSEGEGGSEVGEVEEMPDWDREGAVVTTKRDGYLQSVEVEDLLALAVEKDVVVRVLHRPGDHVVQGEPLFEVWPVDRLDIALAEDLGRHVTIGSQRTPEQDVEFAFDQLVEVAVRALSPGINDPFTAVSCLDQITSGLVHVGAAGAPSPCRYKDGRMRVVVKRSSYAGIASTALDAIRQYGKSSAPVVIRFLTSIERAARQTPHAGRRQILREHADRMIRDARDAGHDPADLADMEARHRRVIAAVEQQAGRPQHPRPDTGPPALP